MDNKKRLAYAIIRFLHDQLRHGGLSSDAQESLEGMHGPSLALRIESSVSSFVCALLPLLFVFLPTFPPFIGA